MKVRTISRNEEDYTRERKQDITKVFRNADPKLHPFEKAREYTRALTATKMERMFAAPFLGSLEGTDAVHSMATFPNSLVRLAAGSADGELRLWDLSTREYKWTVKAHEGPIAGLSSDEKGDMLLTCATDKTVKMWAVSPDLDQDGPITPVATYMSQGIFNGLDHHRSQAMFATCGAQVDVWDPTRSEPVHSFSWGADTIYSVKFNKVESNILSSTASDRNICLYDVRARTPLKKIVLLMRTNQLCWNPQEAFYFTTANEDHKCYTFDMRKLDHAVRIHEDHVSAVMSIDYAPTGKEFVTGGYDRTVRIFNASEGHSREVYHTKRMQRVFAVKWSADNRYVLSGSDDTNIRIWRGKASERVKSLLPREQRQMQYREKLKQRYQHVPEVRKIARYRHVPKAIKSAQNLKHIIKESKARKLANVRKHSKPENVQYVPAKAAVVRKQVE